MLNPELIFQAPVPSSADTPALNKNPDSKQFEFFWTLPENCPYLEGHFPGRPMLPAVATIDGSIEFLKRALHKPDLQPRAIFNAKFLAPITPGLEIKIELKWLADSKWQADWTTRAADGSSTLLARLALTL